MRTVKQVLRFYLIGIVNLILFMLFMKLLVLATNNTLIASFFSSVACIIFSYILLKLFVFSNLFQLKKFLIISFLGFLTTQAYIFYFAPYIQIDYLTVSCAFIVSVQNFLLNKLFND